MILYRGLSLPSGTVDQHVEENQINIGSPSHNLSSHWLCSASRVAKGARCLISIWQRNIVRRRDRR